MSKTYKWATIAVEEWLQLQSPLDLHTDIYMQIKINKTWTLINYSFYVAALAKQKLGSWSAKPTEV